MGLSPFGNCSVYGDSMGRIGPLGGSRCNVYGHGDSIATRLAPNPDPINFEILVIQQVGRHAVVKIRYPDCTNFDGIKICLFLNTDISGMWVRKEIDPHFADNANAPFARFRPDNDGWNIAIKVAENIK